MTVDHLKKAYQTLDPDFARIEREVRDTVHNQIQEEEKAQENAGAATVTNNRRKASRR